ncbi:MAG: sulfurtransferase [bacterium]
MRKNIKTSQWLLDHIDDPGLIVLDATMKKMPNGDSIPVPSKKIPNAQMFDFDTQICDQSTTLPHMLPSPEEFERAVQELGINRNSEIIIYDAMGIFSAPRAWWMFKIMGHKKVSILDGGFPAWLKAGFPVNSEYDQANMPGDFKVQFNPDAVVSSEQILAQLKTGQFKILDARSESRFYAQEPEPRKELKGGHIPGSYCLPFSELIDDDGCYKNTKKLQEIFKQQANTKNQQTVFTCGSGVTACVLALAAEECGLKNYAVYDGSWSEWGLGLWPIETD